ncbi:MAG: TetR/AcrR family transcriptional regulator [Panacagrimonas sp.]|jgi:AcrR family transcriptional regulator|nr:TetR/AcrR family transcriptional regulator [Panacagrimonas sp.]MCC2656702.1 TetR/AcrR family transcriptional regulator [Panacagrimonas sp.]
MGGTKRSQVSKKGAQAAPRPSARDRIFDAARVLFYRQGIHAVGVDSIAQEAGATKMSLYRAFPGKDELVAECLRQSEQEFWRWWDELVAPHAADPRAALLALFEAQTRKQRAPEHRGCPIANAAIELTEDAHPAREVVLEYNREKRRRLRDLCRRLGADAPELLADSLQLLMDGACVSRITLGATGPAASLHRAAAALIDAAVTATR